MDGANLCRECGKQNEILKFYLILSNDKIIFKLFHFSGWDWFIQNRLFMWIVSENVTKPT